MSKDKNIFKAAFYFFVPIEKLTNKYRSRYDDNHHGMKKDSLIRNADGEIDYCDLDEFNHLFNYKYDKISRTVELKVFFVKHSCSLNDKGRFYLVVGTGIDMIFEDGQLCESRDLIKLKKAFYEHGKKGLFYEEGDETITLRKWLDKNLKIITGKDYKGKYSRHYIVNIKAVKVEQLEYLPRQFAKEYYQCEDEEVHFYYDVVKGADELAYALLYGNDNIKAVPEETVEETFKDTFFNNKAEKMFAGNNTIVFIKTRGKYPTQKLDISAPPFIGIEGMLNILDICMVMEAKHKLKRIQKLMQDNHPSEIKDALANISQYLSKNPLRLSEIDGRTGYLYKVLGVKKLFDVVMKQGELMSESSNIRMSMSIDIRMYLLAGITLGVGGLDLFVSILCCDNFNNSSDMCNCFFGGAELQGSCCAVIGVLLGLVLAASIITMAVYQVKSFYKLNDIENKIKNLDK